MRRFIIMMTAVLAGVGVANAQTLNGVNVESYTMERAGNFVVVDMDIDISQLDVKGSEAVVLTPHIVRDTLSVALKSVGVYGRNRDFYYQRNESLSPTADSDLEYRNSKAPDMVTYHAVVPFEEWMDGCQLVFERTDCGCNNSTLAKEGSVLVDRFPLEPYKPMLLYIQPQVERVKTRELSGTAFIDFPVSKMDIQPSYRNNEAEIAKITNSIDVVKSDDDATITSITIKGYASPESSYANNTRLAEGRTASLKGYIESLYNFDSDLITTAYEPEDWAGLERYVEASSLKNRDNILAIIRSESDPDNKEWVLKSSYPEEYAYLLANCYPALRHSDYAIQYTLRHYSDPVEIERIMNTEPQKLSLDEFYILAQTYESGSVELDELWEVAVRMYPNDEIANFNAANSAMDKGDFERAKRYLDKAGDRPEVYYSLGCIEILKEQYEASLDYLYKARAAGVEEAAPVIEAAESHWTVKRNRK
jgi:outer membrane protein OmpA-like peptidoglycan-associated protein